MSRQLDAKADALEQQAKKEKNPIKKADLLQIEMNLEEKLKRKELSRCINHIH